MDDKQEFNHLQKIWFTQIGNITLCQSVGNTETLDMAVTGPLAPCEDEPNESKCPICIGDIINEKNTKCNHSFCESCIDKWLETNNTCPSCRAILIISPTNQSEIGYVPHLNSEIDVVHHLNTVMGGNYRGGALMQFVSYGAEDQYLTIIDQITSVVPIREQKKHSVSRNATARRNIMIQKKFTNRKYR